MNFAFDDLIFWDYKFNKYKKCQREAYLMSWVQKKEKFNFIWNGDTGGSRERFPEKM